MRIDLEKPWATTKKEQKSCVAQTKDGHIEKHRKHFTTAHSPEQLHAKRDPLRGILPHREKESGRTPASLVTASDVCIFYY